MRIIREHRPPGIKYIGWLYADKLKANVALDGIVGQPVPILTDIHQIYFCGDVECRSKYTKEGGSYSDTATLKFLSPTLLPFCPDENIAFVVTDQNDDSWLIGSKEPPHALHPCQMQHGWPDGEESGFLYEISHVAHKSMVPCIISINNSTT